MLIIGKNSFIYSQIRDRLGKHHAISFSEINSIKISSYTNVVILSYPKNNIDFNIYLKKIKYIVAETKSSNNVNLIFISTSGLNGISPWISSQYYYLRSKLIIEKFILDNNGKVLRCGSFDSNKLRNGPNFICQKEELISAIFSISAKKNLSYVGHFIQSGDVSLLQRFSLSLMFLANKSPLFKYLFLLAHLIGFVDKNRGYTLFSNAVFSQTVSIGCGLSSLSSTKMPYQSFVIPYNSEAEIFGYPNYLSWSKKKFGFGSRWHGVRPSEVSNLSDGVNNVKLNIPLFPEGSFIFIFRRCFSNFLYLEADHYYTDNGLVYFSGVDASGFRNIYGFKAAVLNMGILKTFEIVSKSNFIDFNAIFSYQTLSSLFPISLNSNLQISRSGFFRHEKTGYQITHENLNVLCMFRPVLPAFLENKIIMTGFFDRVFLFLKNFSFDLLIWVLYSRFGLAAVDKKSAQVDLQIMHSAEVQFSSGRANFNHEKLKYSSSLYFDIVRFAESNQIFFGKPNTRAIKSGVDALHLTINFLNGLSLRRTKKWQPGNVYIGPVGNLVNVETSLHTSHLLLDPNLYDFEWPHI